jgi:hypothetical protein
LVADVSGQLIGSTFKGQEVQEVIFLKYQAMLCNIPESVKVLLSSVHTEIVVQRYMNPDSIFV